MYRASIRAEPTPFVVEQRSGIIVEGRMSSMLPRKGRSRRAGAVADPGASPGRPGASQSVGGFAWVGLGAPTRSRGSGTCFARASESFGSERRSAAEQAPCRGSEARTGTERTEVPDRLIACPVQVACPVQAPPSKPRLPIAAKGPTVISCLQFMRRTLFQCNAVAPRVTAALLGRFLPRLGPLATVSGPFFYFNSAVHYPTQAKSRSNLQICSQSTPRVPETQQGVTWYGVEFCLLQLAATNPRGQSSDLRPR
jgi:hypothetical protein